MKKENLFETKEIGKLIILLEEVTRATPNGNRFIEPYSGVLDQTKSKRNHLIFGRRGSGKSSLLQKSKKTLNDETIGIYIDFENFNENKYPDILIIVLLSLLKQIKTYYKENYSHKYRIFIKLNPFSKIRKLYSRIIGTIKSLEILLHSEDFAQLEQKSKKINTSRTSLKIEISKMTIDGSNQKETHDEITETFRRSKSNILNRNLSDLSFLINNTTKLFEKAIYLYLDDLYHISIIDQPYLLGFLHKLSKNNNTWLKIGTVRYRSNWYKYTDKPIGLKIGDDASDIDLDLTLEKYSTTKNFLIKLANELIKEISDLTLSKIVNDNAIDRLILASGGVSRDFINLFRKSIINCKERLLQNIHDSNGPRVSVEDVNNASGEYGESKFEEFRKDSHENSMSLKDYFEKIRKFCIEVSNSNCFLVPLDCSNTKIDELIDLKLIHRIEPRVTVSKRQGMVYKGLMLDLSQYAGSRTLRNLDLIEFWKQDNKEKLRKISLILPIEILNE